jgi:amino acid permease
MIDKPGSVEGPHAAHPPHQAFWLWVMCLTGVDYFSTLGYQPSIAVQNAGMLAPLATVVLVLVTLLGALPVYRYVATKSFEGQGSIGMLTRLVSGWTGKVLVLVLLGFAATGFVITKTLSAADAAVHLIENPNWPWRPPDGAHDVRQQVAVTMLLLALLGATFLRGFREVIGLAAVIVGVYLALNLVVIGAGLKYLLDHPEKWHAWVRLLESGQWHLPHNPIGSAAGWAGMVAVSLLLFPKLALGLSGFETGVAVAAHVRGNPGDDPGRPAGRIANTRKLLLTAAAVMSFYLLGSSVVVSTLIPPAEVTPVTADGQLPLDPGGNPIEKVEDWPKKPASGRALAYLAHGEGGYGAAICPLFGPTFGTIYDISTIIILWFAGASAMVGLLNLVPQYLPRYGMAPEWARAVRPLVLLFTVINLLVTVVFRANVDAQGGAYATGVLVLITSACVAAVIDVWRGREGPWHRRLSWPFALITAVFVYTTVANEVEKGFQGLAIASCFILTILVTSLWSRVARSRELRFAGFRYADPESQFLWDTIRHLELTVLVPHRPGRRSLANKEAQIRREHRIPRDLMVVFVQVELADASEFVNEPTLKVEREGGRYVMRVTGAASISHTLAALALEMAKVGRPPEIHFGWSDESPLSVSFGFLLFGEGNIPWMVRELIRRAEPDPARRPLIIIAGTA